MSTTALTSRYGRITTSCHHREGAMRRSGTASSSSASRTPSREGPAPWARWLGAPDPAHLDTAGVYDQSESVFTIDRHMQQAQVALPVRLRHLLPAQHRLAARGL